MTDMRRDQPLIRLDTDVKWIKKNLSNHLQSHLRYSIMAWTTAIGAIISLVIILIKTY